MYTGTHTTTRPIGPRMTQALGILKAHGGTITGKWNLARAVGPHGSNIYGDRTVMRCVARGLIALDGTGNGGRNGAYAVHLTPAGYASLT